MIDRPDRLTWNQPASAETVPGNEKPGAVDGSGLKLQGPKAATDQARARLVADSRPSRLVSMSKVTFWPSFS